MICVCQSTDADININSAVADVDVIPVFSSNIYQSLCFTEDSLSYCNSLTV